jgi:predicted ABC-type ATPase
VEFDFLQDRPIVVAIAGSNGAGKTTFFHSHLADCGLPFVNADDIAAELDIGPYEAAEAGAAVRTAMLASGESFVFETVFSDPVGDKVRFLHEARGLGYQVVLIFAQLLDVAMSIDRVSLRVAQGGHAVPDEKLRARFDRTRENLQRAIATLPHVLVFDNSDLARPYRRIAVYQQGERMDGLSDK